MAEPTAMVTLQQVGQVRGMTGHWMVRMRLLAPILVVLLGEGNSLFIYHLYATSVKDQRRFIIREEAE